MPLQLNTLLAAGLSHEQAEPATLRNIRRVMLGGLCVFLYIPVNFFSYPDHRAFHTLSVAGLVLVVASLCLLWRAPQRRMMSLNLLLLASAMLALGTSLVLGGVDHPAVLTWALIPMGAGLLAGWRTGAVWGVVCCGAVSALWMNAAWLPPSTLTADERLESGLVEGVSAFCVLLVLLRIFLGEQKRAEDKLQEGIDRLRVEVAARTEAERKAQEAVKAKSAFFANMSHEIRTPLNGVLGMAQLLQTAAMTDEQRAGMQTIVSSGECLLALINDVLDLSRLEADKMQLEVLDVDLEALLFGVGELLATRAHAAGLYLYIDAPVLPRGVQSDPTLLRQVLLNLAGNAVKFTHDGGVTIRLEVTGEGLRFSVTDSGIGVSAEGLERIFEPFEQVDASTTRNYAGTGLGLSICRHIVAQLGGQLGAESTPGEGSTFWFTLPQQRLLPPAPPLLAGHTVGIVGDLSPSLLDRVAQLGLERVDLDDAEVLLVDDRMPALPDRDAPILVVGRSDLLSEADRLRAQGASAILIEPVRPTLLAKMLQTRLGLITAEEAPPDAPETLSLRVMLVEDHPVNQVIARRMLEELGCEVVVCGTAEDALAKLPLLPVDVVLMDVHLPGMDGLQATRQLRADGFTLPVLALTASALSEERQACMESGMDAFLTKPLMRDAIRGALHALPRAA